MLATRIPADAGQARIDPYMAGSGAIDALWIVAEHGFFSPHVLGRIGVNDMDSRRPENFPERGAHLTSERATRALRAVSFALMGLIGSALASCALWPTPYAEPQIQLVKLTADARPGHSPRYRIQMRILNPGNRELAIAGLSCHLKIDSLPSVESFTGPLRTLPPGSTLLVEMEARTNGIDQLKLTGMLADGVPPHYVLKVHLRREWAVLPVILIQSGTLPWEANHES